MHEEQHALARFLFGEKLFTLAAHGSVDKDNNGESSWAFETLALDGSVLAEWTTGQVGNMAHLQGIVARMGNHCIYEIRELSFSCLAFKSDGMRS